MDQMQEAEELCPEEMEQLIATGGPLSLCQKGFESRPQQKSMLRDVVRAYNSDEISIIEAGTGTGKSIAYLIPALHWALLRQERTVVSTKTIALQQQLISKDIPRLANALGIQVKAVLVKGMANYLCLRRLEESLDDLSSISTKEADELMAIDQWKKEAREGTRAELSLFPSETTWERVRAEGDACPQKTCPHYERCFFFAARKEASDAQILVANHALLFTDLKRRAELKNYDGPGLMPSYKRLILDEAHHVEHVATELLAERLSQRAVERCLNRLISELGGGHGRLQALQRRLEELFKEVKSDKLRSILARLSLDLPSQKRNILWMLGELFSSFELFIRENYDAQGKDSQVGTALRIRQVQLLNPYWKETLVPAAKNLTEELSRFIAAIHCLEADLDHLDSKKLEQLTQGLRSDINALIVKLVEFAEGLMAFMSKEECPEEVRWIEITQKEQRKDCILSTAQLNIAPRLASTLFTRFPTTILCSATLATDRRFDFLRNRLGLCPGLLSDKVITEAIYDAPFDYQKQALLAVPMDLPPQKHPHYTEATCAALWRLLQASRGNAFVLFTSYSQLLLCYQMLEKKLLKQRYTPMRQGQEARQRLLERFRRTDRSVLFGTDSFWEGVDVVGDALRCVIIVKLPFHVPTEPLFQAQTEWIASRGGNPFMQHTVPHAIVKFKQGFGRLIRNRKDRGCIVCLDARLVNKPYGAQFINSLPPCPRIAGSLDEIVVKMEDFYRRSYRLTQS